MEELQYYKESTYLDDRNQEVIQRISDMHDCYEHIKLINAGIYDKNIMAYNEFVKLIAYLIKSMNIPNNAITASMIIDILIKKGLFSENGKYSKGKNMKERRIGFSSIALIEGIGVCRNTTSFHSDVFRALNMMSYPFYCYATFDSLENGNDYEANHVINLIEHNGTLYGYDAFNSMLFKFVSDREMLQMFSKEPLKLYYKPYVDVIVESLTLGNVNNLMALFGTVKDNELITVHEYLSMWKYAKKVTSENDFLFNLFKDTSKKRIKEITKGLN